MQINGGGFLSAFFLPEKHHSPAAEVSKQLQQAPHVK
jgi:hypothetical protein